MEDKKEIMEDLDCLSTLVKSNYFSSAKYILEYQFADVENHNSNTAKHLNKA